MCAQEDKNGLSSHHEIIRQMNSVMNVPHPQPSRHLPVCSGETLYVSVIFICKFIVTQSRNHTTVTGEKKISFKSRRRRKRRGEERRKRQVKKVKRKAKEEGEEKWKGNMTRQEKQEEGKERKGRKKK